MTEQIIGDIIGISLVILLAVIVGSMYPEETPRSPKVKRPDEPIQPTFLG
jgi:hypothetical protein